jgi:deoxyribonuclease V
MKKQIDALLRFGKLAAIQMSVADKVTLIDSFKNVNLLGAADQAFCSDFVLSCVVVLNQEMEVVDRAYAVCRAMIPYIPGLLSFREGPPIIAAYNKLKTKPDVLLVDGCGINHLRFAGLATYVGVVLNVPTIGVSKKKLCGEFTQPTTEGEIQQLIYKDKIVGFAFKSKQHAKPIFVSPGTGISLTSSLKIVQDCLKNHRLPEPIRIAHNLVNEFKCEICKQC